jgi:hypothetical protein
MIKVMNEVGVDFVCFGIFCFFLKLSIRSFIATWRNDCVCLCFVCQKHYTFPFISVPNESGFFHSGNHECDNGMEPLVARIKESTNFKWFFLNQTRMKQRKHTYIDC